MTLWYNQILNAADMPYQDVNFGCQSQAVADRYIHDFRIDVDSFGGPELCKSEIDTKKLLNDINIIENGHFENSAQNNLIKGFIDSTNYYGWMKQQTYGVARGNDVPYATAYNSGGYFTMQDGWAKSSTLGRVGVFVHEARHTEGYRHIVCNQGTYQGTSVLGCDRDYNYGGSHAVEMEYYARVAVQGTNFHPVYKKMARLMAIARSNIFFNTSPLQTREGLLALSMDRKQAFMFDRGQWLQRELPEAVGKLKRTSFGAVLFDGVKALAIELYQNSGFKDAVTDTYSYYKLLIESKEESKEFEEFDSGFKRYVIRITNDNKLAAYNFPNGAWGAEQQIPFDVVKTTTSIPGMDKSGIFLLTNSGQIYAYQPDSQRLVSQVGSWDFNNVQVVRFQNENLILKNNGQIYRQTDQKLEPWVEAKLPYSDVVTVPLYDAFEVVKE